MSDRVKSYLNRLGPGARLVSNSRTPSPLTCSSLVVHPMSSVPSSCPPTPVVSGSASENGAIPTLSRSSDGERATLPLTTAISSANSAVGESGSQASYPPATPSGDTVNGSWPPPPPATPSGDTVVGPVSLSVPSNMVNRGAVLPSASYSSYVISHDTVGRGLPPLSVPSNMVDRGGALPSASYPSSVISDVTVGGSWPPPPPAVPSGDTVVGAVSRASSSYPSSVSVDMAGRGVPQRPPFPTSYVGGGVFHQPPPPLARVIESFCYNL